VAAGSSSDFGTQVLGTSATEAFTVGNSGQAGSTALSVSLSGADYAILTPVNGDCINGATTLAVGASCTIHVGFTPTMAGVRPGSLAVSAIVGGSPPAITLTAHGKYATGTIAEFPVPVITGFSLEAITFGPDGKIWFCNDGVESMTLTGTVTAIPNSDGNGAGCQGISFGPDGDIWYTLVGTAGGIGHATTGGTVYTPLPTNNFLSRCIEPGPDGNMWFTQPGGSNAVGRINAQTHVIDYFTIPTTSSSTYQIVSGPDGALWFTEFNGNKIGRITTSGTFSEIDIPTASAGAYGIASGPDGNVWFVEYSASKVARVNLSDNTIKEFPTPTTSANPYSITAGPDGNLWFTEGMKVGRITPSGTITEYGPTSATGTIVSGADGNLWFGEQTANKIGRITP
jgi:virginiamycin B lyase